MKIEKGNLLFVTNRGIECLSISEVHAPNDNTEITIRAYLFKDSLFLEGDRTLRPQCGVDNQTGLLALTEGNIIQKQVTANKIKWVLTFVAPLDCKLWCFLVEMEDPHHIEKYVSKNPGVKNGRWDQNEQLPR